MLHADRKEEQRWDKHPAEIAVSLEPFGVRMLIVRKGPRRCQQLSYRILVGRIGNPSACPGRIANPSYS